MHFLTDRQERVVFHSGNRTSGDIWDFIIVLPRPIINVTASHFLSLRIPKYYYQVNRQQRYVWFEEDNAPGLIRTIDLNAYYGVYTATQLMNLLTLNGTPAVHGAQNTYDFEVMPNGFVRMRKIAGPNKFKPYLPQLWYEDDKFFRNMLGFAVEGTRDTYGNIITYNQWRNGSFTAGWPYGGEKNVNQVYVLCEHLSNPHQYQSTNVALNPGLVGGTQVAWSSFAIDYTQRASVGIPFSFPEPKTLQTFRFRLLSEYVDGKLEPTDTMGEEVVITFDILRRV